MNRQRAAENVGISFGLTRRNGGWSFSRLGKGSHTSRDSCEASCVSRERSLILQVINCHPKNFAVSINCHFIATHVCRELWRQFHKYRVVLLFSNNKRQLLPRKTNVDDWIKSFAFRLFLVELSNYTALVLWSSALNHEQPGSTSDPSLSERDERLQAHCRHKDKANRRAHYITSEHTIPSTNSINPSWK